MKPIFFFAALFILAASSLTQAAPAIDVRSDSGLLVSSANIVPAPGGGIYVFGQSRPATGVSAPSFPRIHVAAYDHRGKPIAEKTTLLNQSRLTVNRYTPRPRAPYAIYLPVKAAEIGTIIIAPHSGHRHTGTKNFQTS